jgi:ElaB/YqjD/DUF883 family membrane-anchored ribosome-binding protein
MTATDQIRTVIRDLEAKAKQMELDRKLATFADQADHYLRIAANRAGDYAAEHRDSVEANLDKAGAKVDEKTEGKYTRYVGKVRAGVLTGVDWLAEQREPATPAGAGDTASGTSGDFPASAASGPPTTTSTAPDATSVPTTSAPGDAADVTPSGTADSDVWVEVTDHAPGSIQDTTPDGPAGR